MSAILNVLNNRKKEVELSSEKVELAGIADLKKLTKSVESKIKSLKSLGSKYDELAKEIRSELDSSKNLGVADAADFVKKAQDLGVKPDSVPEYKTWVSVRDALGEELSKGLKRIK